MKIFAQYPARAGSLFENAKCVGLVLVGGMTTARGVPRVDGGGDVE